MTTQPDDAGPARVFLVDDHRVVRTGPAGHLATEPGMTVVGEASDGRQALDQLTVLHRSGALPDVVMAADVPLPVVPAPTPATGSSRAFAAARPDAVAGLVLVDATHEDEWTDRYPDAHRRGLARAACPLGALAAASAVGIPQLPARLPFVPLEGSTGCHRRTAPSSGVGGVGAWCRRWAARRGAPRAVRWRVPRRRRSWEGISRTACC